MTHVVADRPYDVDGRPHIVKYAHLDADFTMRVSGDLVCRPVRAWAAGLLDSAPDLVDHTVVGAALGHGRNGWGAAMLMLKFVERPVMAWRRRIRLVSTTTRSSVAAGATSEAGA